MRAICKIDFTRKILRDIYFSSKTKPAGLTLLPKLSDGKDITMNILTMYNLQSEIILQIRRNWAFQVKYRI